MGNWWDTLKQRATEAGVRYDPRSWRYKNQLFYNHLLDEFLQGIDAPGQRLFPERCRKAAAKLDQIFAHGTPFNFLAAVAIPN